MNKNLRFPLINDTMASNGSSFLRIVYASGLPEVMTAKVFK